MRSLVRERRDVALDALALALVVATPVVLIAVWKLTGVGFLIEADLVSILALAVIVLSLNLVAGYTGIPHFGLHLFVYIGAFGMSAMAMRLYIAIVGLADSSLRESLLSDEIIARYAGSLQEVLVQATYRTLSARVSDIIGSHASSSFFLWLLYLSLGLFSSVLLSLLFAFVLGLVALRLRGDYLAIFSLVLAELMVTVIFHNLELLGGGAYGVSAPQVIPHSGLLSSLNDTLRVGSPSFIVTTALLLAVLIAVYAYSVKVSNSPLGRLLRGIRDDEVVAGIFGRDVGAVKMRVLILGCVIASLAGAIYTLYMLSVIPTSFDRMNWTFLPWTMMILGGMANNRGVIVGALLVYLLRRLSSLLTPEVLEAAASAMGVSLESHAVTEVQAIMPHIVTGVLVLLVLYLRPQGLIPEEPSKTLRPRVLSATLHDSSRESS